MENNSIHPDTTVASVHLTVSNLERSLAFYQHALGFQIHGRNGKTARLGAGKADFLVLTEQPGAKPYPNRTGLYHFAILVPSRLELARSLKHLAETQTPLQGFADHLVSEAIYLADPDGNGIEIYRDRPRSEWRYSNGAIQMATDPLDIDGVLAELKTHTEEWKGVHPDTRLGHMHLQVANIKDSEAFYCGVLGFDLMARYGPSALFVSAGGYHHHIGLNTWNSYGAAPPPPNSIGLRYFEIRLPNAAELDKVADRVKKAGVSLEETSDGSFLHDPSQNGIFLTAAA